MHVQRTWEAILNASVELDDVLVIAAWLPLTHMVELVRPLTNGEIPAQALAHLAALAFVAGAAFWLALALTRRRLLR